MTTAIDDALPGADLIRVGLDDVRHGRDSVEALLVLVGAPRLRRIGIDVPERSVVHPEHRLYELLARSDSDTAHSRYNALIRRLVSFERAAECAQSRRIARDYYHDGSSNDGEESEGDKK